MKGFLDKLKSVVSTMWKKAPSVVVWIASAINQLVPVVEELDVIADPADAVVINPVLEKIKVGLAALKVVMQDAGGAPNAKTIVTAVLGHLDALEGVAGIKNADTKAKVAKVAGVLRDELTTIGALLPALKQ